MITSTLQNEFWFHVSPQEDMPIAGDVPEFVNTTALEHLLEQFESKSKIDGTDISNVIKSDVNNIDLLRALVGISDKRMYLDLSYLFYKTKFNDSDTTNILGQDLYNVNCHPLDFFKNKILSSDQRLSPKATEIISDYLVEAGIVAVINALSSIGSEQAHILIDKLINAKEAQQKLTKRRGHGIEQKFAQFLHDLKVNYLPSDRNLNPMARDPNVDKKTFNLSNKINGKTWAFDLIIESNTIPKIFIQSLIHTSDPGQYGVNKSDETVIIKQDVSSINKRDNFGRELWGLVDGVGFTENKTNTIDKMLQEFDTFIQLKTFYKAALKLHSLKEVKLIAISFNPIFYTNAEAQHIYNKYASKDIGFYYGDTPQSYSSAINAGEATVFI